MSAPNLNWWLPLILVMFPTHWNCCSRSMRGQLQRATPRPSPKFDSFDPVLFPAELTMSNSPRPDVKLSPMFALGIPKFVIAVVPASGLFVIGLYLNQPNRKSPSSVELKVLVAPIAKL